jgi:hypothetical protein
MAIQWFFKAVPIDQQPKVTEQVFGPYTSLEEAFTSSREKQDILRDFNIEIPYSVDAEEDYQ